MKGLRIGWAAPWNWISAVAQSASEVAFALVDRGHVVTVLRTEVGGWAEKPPRPAPGPVRHLAEYSDFDLRSDFDVLVAHVGDNYEFHGALLPRLDTVGIAGIFHDACVPHLIRGWVGDQPDLLRAMVEETYHGMPGVDQPLVWDDLTHVARYHPMVEWLARRMTGAIAHAHHYAERLSDQCPGPIAVIPLAFDVPGLPPPPTTWDRIRIGVVGHANANKRIDQIILAIGASYLLRMRCRVRVIGSAEPERRQELTALARDLGVEPPEFTGWVSDEDLRWQLRDVDVISCLRNPVLEGASASMILGLLSGRPTLVTHHGSYGEVPDNAVLACSPDHEARDVLRHLERLLREPGLGARTGAAGRAFATGRHTASAYAEALEPILKRVASAKPIDDARRSLRETLVEFGLDREDHAVLRILAAVN